MEFKIDYPKPKTLWTKKYSLNRYYSGVHWSIRKKDADYWHLLTLSAIQGLKPTNKPVILTFYFNDGLDISNHAAMAKMIEDGLFHDYGKEYFQVVFSELDRYRKSREHIYG